MKFAEDACVERARQKDALEKQKTEVQAAVKAEVEQQATASRDSRSQGQCRPASNEDMGGMPKGMFDKFLGFVGDNRRGSRPRDRQ